MRFASFLLRRLLYSALVLLSLSVLIFVIARVLPGDPARLALGAFATREQVEQLRQEMGLDQPLPLQYFAYVSGALRGDFGKSFFTGREVGMDLARGLPATLELVLAATFWILIVGIPLGVLSARYRDSFIDNATRSLAFVGVAVPAFVVGLTCQLAFSYGLGVLPTVGRLSIMMPKPPHVTGFMLIDSLIAGRLDTFVDAFRHIVLPSISLALVGIGQIARITRASMIDVMSKDYIEASRAFGIPARPLALKYTLRPAFIPPLTVLGLVFAFQLSNAFLIETVFAWPGMAKYGIQSILRKDFNAIMGVVLIVGIAFVVVNFVVDILAGFVDPRIRKRGEAVGQ
ncbi:ABC transporter permease [Candidatus Bipolaricaulota bacterium]